MGEVVKLHGSWFSPFNYRVIWALKLKGIPYEYVEEDLSNKSSLLLRYNPVHKKIPVLVHAGKPICESMIIIEYIDEVWPENPLLPSDPHDRAAARFWIKLVEDQGIAIRKMVFAIGEESKKAMEETLKFLETIEKHGFGGGKKIFNGEKIGMVDIALGSVGYWLGMAEEAVGVKLLEPQTFPLLHSWMEKFKQAPIIKENLPKRDMIVVMFKHRREMLK